MAILLKPLEAEGSGRVNAKWEWGGNEGSKFSGGVSFKIHDDKGKFAELEIKQDQNSKESAEVSSGYEKEKKAK